MNTRIAVESMRRDVQAEIGQNHADAQHRDDESQRQVEKIAADLATLTEQFNRFKPTSEVVVGSAQKQVSEAVEARLNLQSQRIDSVNESV